MLNPSYLLPKEYLQLKQQVRDDISKAHASCITTDGWTSDKNESFLALTAHYIDPEAGQLRANLLGCVEYDKSHTAVNLCQFIEEELKEWKIDNKVCVIVSDNAANILAAVQLGHWRSVGCFAHSLNLTVQAGIGQICETVNKVKKVVEYFHRSTTGQNRLKSVQKQMNLKELKLKQDVCTRWNSTYDMLERIATIREAVIATLVIPDLALSPEDWTLIESALPILKIFYEVTVEVSTETSVSLSKVIVYCRLLSRQISWHLSQAARETSKIHDMLVTLEKQLQDRFSGIENNLLHAEATILDPRFKSKGFRDEHYYRRALSSLKLKVGAMRTLAPTSNFSEASQTTSQMTEHPQTTSSKPATIWDDFDEEVSRLVPVSNTAAGIVELDKYIQEPMISRLEDPLLWWYQRRSVYPLLYKYVLKRLNIVATSMPCKRVFSKAGLTPTSRRRKLKANKLSMLLFIGSNRK